MTMYGLKNDAAGLVGADGGGTGVALMTSDPDHYRSANVLIHEHGEDAGRKCRGMAFARMAASSGASSPSRFSMSLVK